MKITQVSSLAILIVVIIAALYLGKALFIPLVVAIGIWLLVNAISDAIARIPVVGTRLPGWLRKSVATVIILGFIWLCGIIIIESANQMIAQADEYKARLTSIIEKGLELVGLHEMPTMGELSESIDFQSALTGLGGAISGFAGDFILVVFYTLFLLFEQGTLTSKWRMMFKRYAQYKNAGQTIDRIVKSIREYVLVKSAVNIATGLLCWIVMQAVGQDFALFWGFMIFLLNYIPTFGTIGGIGFPILFALLQFEEYGPVVIVAVGVTVAHGIIDHLLEPRLIGRALNISPLVILIALSFWGILWGLIGMILAIPITVTLMTVLAAFPSTRPIAVWISEDMLLEEDDDVMTTHLDNKNV
jgi:AI-2 transport protein TqsA